MLLACQLSLQPGQIIIRGNGEWEQSQLFEITQMDFELDDDGLDTDDKKCFRDKMVRSPIMMEKCSKLLKLGEFPCRLE